MLKRISLLIAAALLVATMAVAGLAGPAFAQNENAGFTTKNPGGQEQGCGGNNPNCETTNRGGNAPPGQNK